MSTGACENPLIGIVAKAITERLRNPPKRPQPRPTIAELEKMLNVDEPGQKVEILPDGSITVELPTYAADLASAAISAIYAAGFYIDIAKRKPEGKESDV